MTASTLVAKRDTLNLRIEPEVRGLIDRAAKVRGKNRTDFILDAAQQAAEDAHRFKRLAAGIRDRGHGQRPGIRA